MTSRRLVASPGAVVVSGIVCTFIGQILAGHEWPGQSVWELVKVLHAPAFLITTVRSTMCDMVENINIKAAPKKKIPVTLIGIDYTCRAPKGRLAMTLAARFKQAQKTEDASEVDETLNVIIDRMFGKDVAPQIVKRLDDPDDDLDIDHIMELMNGLIEAAQADPTT